MRFSGYKAALAVLLCLCLLLAGCGAGQAAPDAPADSTPAESESAPSESELAAAARAQQLRYLQTYIGRCRLQMRQNDWDKDEQVTALVDAADALAAQPAGTADAAWDDAAADMLQQLRELLPTLKQKRPPVIEEIDGVTYADGVLIVNKSYTVPEDYGDGITPETQAAFNAMQTGAAADGVAIFICSGFRDYRYQRTLYRNYAARDGYAAADTYSARPGHSEHQTGLALDINSTDGSMATSPEGLWLADHCAEYGFIIRYPQGKEDITGYMYEPWHVRYVGVELATELTAAGLTLEEYFGLDSVYADE